MRFVAQQLLPVLSTVPGDPLPRMELASARPMQEQEALPARQAGEGIDLASLQVSHLDTGEWAVEPTPDGIFRLGCLRVRFTPRNE